MDENPHPVLHDVTVVIPTIGRDLLEGCLRSIADGTAWPARLIVVDQGSNPAGVAGWVDGLAARGMATEHVVSRQRGAAAARNRGFERARTRFVAATDDDCHVTPHWLERLAARLRAEPDALVSGRVDAKPHEGGGEAPSLVTGTASVVHRRALLRRDPLGSNNMGFAVETVERFGPMDEHPTVRYAEDAEWSYRALRAGVRIVYAPEVVVEHVAWRDRAEMSLVYRRYAYSQGGFYGHYLRRGDLFIALRTVFDLLRGPWFVLRGLATRNAELGYMGRAYVTQLLPGTIAGWQRGPS